MKISFSGLCFCKIGYMKHYFGCKECDKNTYGQNCSQKCECVDENSLDCDVKTGICQCKTGWKGM